MKLYIAGAHSNKLRLKAHAEQVSALGYEVTSRWLDESQADYAAGTWSGDAPRDGQTAMRDVTDVKRADGIILDTIAPSTTGGYATEWGVAITRLMRMRVVVGPFRNGFQVFGAHRRFETWEELLAWLSTQ